MVSDAWGVDDGYWDALGDWHDTSTETREALRAVMGEPAPSRHVRVVHLGEQAALDAPGQLTLEDGSELALEATLPPDLPIGYHDFRPAGDDDALPTRLIVTPGRCHLPDDLHTWALTIQLHACRSERSW